MKRRVDDTAKVEGGPPTSVQRTVPTVVHQYAAIATIKERPSEGGTQNPVQFPIQQTFIQMPSVTSNIKNQSGGGLQGGAQQGNPLIPHIRHNKVQTGGITPPAGGGGGGGAGGGTTGTQQQFQRLKVEDALSYLDQVKYKFGNQPQVYNDFLDIMKEFKSQCIDTPGVIARVSNLFKGYPELISGFNTFLPPGYKIEVQANDTGYSLQVSVSMASPLGGSGTGSTTHHTISDIPPLIQTQPSVVVSNQPPKSNVFGNSGGLVTTQAGGVHIKTERGSSSSTTGGSGSGGGSVTTSGGSASATPSPACSTASAAQQPVATSLAGNTVAPTTNTNSVSSTTGGPQPIAQGNHQTNQPVEFNHAINYVNKIKNRFQGQPDKYKRFLEILHTYQKEQRTVKEGGGGGGSGGKHLTEAEVYSQVAKLFEHQEDLLAEFGQFLPDATSHNSALATLSNKCGSGGKSSVGMKYNSSGGGYGNNKSSPPSGGGGKAGGCQGSKRSVQDLYSGSSAPTPASAPSSHPAKRQKLQSLAPTLQHYANFDNIKKTLRHQTTYDNILRCIYLYNEEVLSRSELMVLIAPILGRFPDHVHWLKEFLGTSDLALPMQSSVSPPPPPPQTDIHNNVRPERPEPTTTDIGVNNIADFSTCKRIGASYCALPKTHNHPKCSGRTALCREVLNDNWVSFPTWSEEATFVTSRKTQYEEYIYRCEDERFELDLVIECNAATIRVLDGVQRRMSRMSPEEVAKFKLDDTLGGTSHTIHIRALKRIYGEKAADIVEGLKKNPSVAVPVVLRRLKAKEIEWRQAQKGFNKIWREQNEKFYLKSLDHQGINFKQNDLKALRSKSLYNEIESAYDERHEHGSGDDKNQTAHIVLPYKDRSILDDAANLLIHHVKRQTTIHKQDKQRIKQLLRHFIPDLFHHPRQELSDDERDEDEKMEVDGTPPNNNKGVPTNGPIIPPPVKEEPEVELLKEEPINCEPILKDDPDRIPVHAVSPFPDEEYAMFVGNNNWYLFLRLHQILCDRLARMFEKSTKIAEEEAQYSTNRKESTAVALRLKPNEHVQDCYIAMMDMVKSVLDCSMDPSTYEDTLRNMFGIHAYIGFTLDRVVTYAVRQLQQLVTEESCMECWDMHTREKLKGGTGGFCRTAQNRIAQEAAYTRAITTALSGENSYKMYIYKRDCKVTIELLDNDGEEDGSLKNVGKWSEYVDHLVDPSQKFDPSLRIEDRKKFGKAVFLDRNVRSWHKKQLEEEANAANNGNKIEGCDDTQCKVLTNDKMVYVVNKDSILYRRNCLYNARKAHNVVSRRLCRRFSRWHSHWAESHVSLAQTEEARTWLMGLLPDTTPNNTLLLTDNPLDKPPYRIYNRYKVSYPPALL